MSLDTLTDSHKTWGQHLRFPTPPFLFRYPGQGRPSWQCRPERSIPSRLFCTDNFTPQFKRLFSENFKNLIVNWPAMIFFSQHTTPENGEMRKCDKCDRNLSIIWWVFVCVCYLSVARSTRWWQWGHRWRWKPAVPERHLSLHMVLHCESRPLHRDLR